MKNFFLSLSAVAVFGTLSAFDLAEVKPGVQFTSIKSEKREKLFTDTKPVNSIFHLGKKDSVVNTTIEVTPEHELLIKPDNASPEAKFSVRLAVPKCEKMQISFSVKTTAFCARNKADRSLYNLINFYAGGVNLALRGDTRDLRHFDGNAQKYVRSFVVKDGEWSNVTIDISCGDNPLFSLNDIKDILQRGECKYVRIFAISGRFPLAKADTSVVIKNLKITAAK